MPSSLESVNLERIFTVNVWLRGFQKPFSYTCYDEGQGVVREEEGRTLVNLVSLINHPEEPIRTHWHEIVPSDAVERTERLPWLGGEGPTAT